MLKEFSFLFNLVLGLAAHYTFCHVSWCEFLLYLDPLLVQVKIVVRILSNEAHELKDPFLGYIFGWTFLDSFQQISVLALSFLTNLGVSAFLLSLFTDPVARNLCIH